MIDFRGGPEAEERCFRGLQWLRQRANKSLRLIGYNDGPRRTNHAIWGEGDFETSFALRQATQFIGFFFEVYFDDPEEEILFKLRFT